MIKKLRCYLARQSGLLIKNLTFLTFISLFATNFTFAGDILCGGGSNKHFVIQSGSYDIPVGTIVYAGYIEDYETFNRRTIYPSSFEKYRVTRSDSYNFDIAIVNTKKANRMKPKKYRVSRSFLSGNWRCEITDRLVRLPSYPEPDLKTPQKPAPVVKTPTKPVPVVKAPTKPKPLVKVPTKPKPVVKAPTQDDQTIPASSGSGFAVSSDGYVITNSHVIESCQDVFIHTPQKNVKMRVISNDPKNDLALLKGNFKPSAVFSLSSERPEILQDIYVAGYPFGYKVSSSVKVTKGIISSLTGIGNNFSNIQIDAALQNGNSGGPILDDMGNVVGVAVEKLGKNMQMLKNTANIPENTNFGIKASVVKSVLDSSSVDTPAANKSAISKSQLGKMITDGTYYISCWMTMAQIEKVRSKKVLFSELD